MSSEISPRSRLRTRTPCHTDLTAQGVFMPLDARGPLRVTPEVAATSLTDEESFCKLFL